MLAVLPFENLGSPDQEYFADGITEEITSRLSGISGLGVIARTSTIQYKKSSKTLQQIAGELGVTYILQGTIRWGATKEGVSRVRVNPALIKVNDATQVWSQPFEGEVSDVFKLQSDIASEVAGALGITLMKPEKALLEAKPTENTEAYNLYLRGFEYYRRSYLEQDFQIGIQMLQKAVELDPGFALAYALLSEAHSAMYWFHFDHTRERLEKARAAVEEALRLDPNLPEAHESMGFYYYWGQLDYENALKEFAVTEKSRPTDSHLLLAIGAVYRRQGKMEEAAARMVKAGEFDPRSSGVAFNTAQTFRLLRNYKEAERYDDRSISLSPDLLGRYTNKVFLYLMWDGNTQRARRVLKEASTIAGYQEDQAAIFEGVLIEMIDGNYHEGLSIISSSSLKAFDDQYRFIPRAQFFAQVYALMDQPGLKSMYADSARIILEKKILDHPDDARFHSALGIAYAGLGRNEDAIREGKRGVELLPIAKEAWRGTYRVYDLAHIYVLVGAYDPALDQLETLLTIPSDVSAPLLRADPTWAPLRNNPRFEKLVAGKK